MDVDDAEPEDLQSFLLQVAQESEPVGAKKKVLAAMSGVEDLSLALAQSGTSSDGLPPRDDALRKAKAILDEVSAAHAAGERAVQEEEELLLRWEREASLAASAASSEKQKSRPLVEAEVIDLAPIAGRLSDLGSEVASILAKAGIEEELLIKARAVARGEDQTSAGPDAIQATTSSAAAGGIKDSVGSQSGQPQPLRAIFNPGLPSLQSANLSDEEGEEIDEPTLQHCEKGRAQYAGLPLLRSAGLQDSDSDDESLFMEEADRLGNDVDGAGPSQNQSSALDSLEAQPLHTAVVGPSLDLRRSLEIDLPRDEGCWDDADLERVLFAMDAHFGDRPAQHDIEEQEIPLGKHGE